jgi:hypothetical protein
VAGSQQATVQWLLVQSEAPVDAVQVAAHAAKHASLAMLQWACTLQPDWTESDAEAAACGAAAAATDAIEKLDWLHNRFPEHQLATPRVARQGTEAGVVQSLQWLAAQGLDLRRHEFTETAASHGQFSVLRYLIEAMGSPWNADVCRAAAKLGSA